MWQHAGTDGYCVPTEAARDRLRHDGIDPAIIHVTGIPIDPRFAALPDRPAAARRLQLDPDRPVVLIMGGGLGVGLMEAIAQSLRAHPLEAQLVFITGQQSRAAPQVENHVTIMDRARLRRQHARLVGGGRCGDQQSGRPGRIRIVSGRCAHDHSVPADRPRSHERAVSGVDGCGAARRDGGRRGGASRSVVARSAGA